MDTGSSGSNVFGKGKKSDKTRRVWTIKEEEVLLQGLKNLVSSGWKSDNGFRCGFLAVLEGEIRKAFPNSDLRANPHINSKIHVWKRTHGMLVTMLSRSGIGWNNSEGMIEASDEAWETFIKGDSSARTMRYKRWPLYHDWCEIFGNDRATGQNSVQFADVIQDVLNINTDVVPDMEVNMEELFRNVEEKGESMSVSNPPFNAAATKQKNSKKRKSTSLGEELFVSAVDKFTEMSWSTMSDLVKRVGVEYDSVNATKDVFDALGRIPELTTKERVSAAALLVEKPKQLTLFFSLPDEARLDLVRMVIDR